MRETVIFLTCHGVFGWVAQGAKRMPGPALCPAGVAGGAIPGSGVAGDGPEAAPHEFWGRRC